METQYHLVNTKIKQVFEKRGQPYTRKGYDCRVGIAERFSKKCDLLGESESRTVERLIEAFLVASGWGPDTKQGPVFEPNVASHVRDAAYHVAKDLRF